MKIKSHKKRINFLLLFVGMILMISCEKKIENSQIEMIIEKFESYEESIKFNISIKNNFSQDIYIEDLILPFEKNFKITDLSDPESVIEAIPVSIVRPYKFNLIPNQEILFEVDFLAIMKKGGHNIEIDFFDKNDKIIARSVKEIHLDKSIECNNFSKAAQIH